MVKDALPKWYIGLSYLFGKSSKLYDEYKGAFAFCAKMELTDASDTSYAYLCKFLNYRSYVEIFIYKVLPVEKMKDIDNTVYQALFSEFPKEVYNVFYEYMFGFCEGFSSTAPKKVSS